MAILTYAEYLTYPTGVTVSQQDFAALDFWAETAVNSYLGKEYGSTAPAKIKLAVATQIALSSKAGGVDYYAESSGSATKTSESVPDYSYIAVAKTKTSLTAASDVYGLFPSVLALLAGYKVAGVKVMLR